jgi:lipopolysaccharide transport system permease protein
MTAIRLREDFYYDAGRPEAWRRVREDLSETALRAPLVSHLAALDILERYRGSVLGPFWLTLSTLVLIATLGLVYSRLFGMELAGYLPWLATSLVLWNLLNATIQESCHAFVAQEGMIRSMPLPFTMHVARVVVRNLLVFAHNLPIVALTVLIFRGVPGREILWFVPALLLVGLLLSAVGLVLAIICARFRDIPQVSASLLQILFFVTPVIWLPELLGDAAVWLWLNPMHPVLDLLRAPLLGQAPSIWTWLAVLGWAAAAGTLALAFLARYRPRIPFWL